jgi:hypothetical protein
MDTTTDTIAIPSKRGGSLPQLRLELLEPILNDDQLVGRVSRYRPNHQEAPVVFLRRWSLESTGKLEQYQVAPTG